MKKLDIGLLALSLGIYVLAIFLLIKIPRQDYFSVNKQTINLLISNKLCFIEEKKFRSYFSIQNELTKFDKLSPKLRQRIAKAITKASISYDVSPKTILALIMQESSLRPQAESPVGAKGLTQLMPTTAKYICGLSSSQLLDIDLNVQCGTRYLKQLMNEFDQDIELALAAYNSGPTRVKRIQKRFHKLYFSEIKKYLPKETQKYVISIESKIRNFA